MTCNANLTTGTNIIMNEDYIDPVRQKYMQDRLAHWNAMAIKMRHWKSMGKYYQKRLAQIYSQMIPPGSKVLDIGCSDGDLLATLKPSVGVGIDIAPEMVALAKEKHPECTFITAEEDKYTLDDTFDYVLISDFLNEAWDVQSIFEHFKLFVEPDARILINSYNRLWEYPLMLVEKIGLAKPQIGMNWLTPEDITSLLDLSGFDTIRETKEILFPVGIPLLSSFLNRFLVRFWPFNHLAITNFIVASVASSPYPTGYKPRVSVIVPARNEAGNIEKIIRRVPEFGSGTELIFVEGNSIDNTYQVIEETIQKYPEKKCVLLKQTGTGKGDAVRLGFSRATGEVLMILDADLTVTPEDLPRFYEALVSGKGKLINGVRLVYPMEEDAMRFFNLLGNKFFSLAFSWLLGQPIKDTLCGTKVLWKKDYERIKANRSVLGEFDPFGDFDLLFGAALLNFKIIDLPIRYHARTYGTTNIQRWKHGWLLLRMVLFAARKIKFK